MNDGLAARLLEALRIETGDAALGYRGEPAPLRGGFWADLLAFRLDRPPAGWDGDLVARIMPDPDIAAKERIVQTAVSQAGVPTPAVRGGRGPDNPLGRAYTVMDLASGAPLLAGLESIGGLVGAPRRLWRMPDVLAAVMAQLHRADAEPVRAQLAGLAGVSVTLPDMIGWLRSKAELIDRPDLVQAAQWFLDHPDHADELVICHGDLHPFNVLDGGGRLTLLDWSVALIAPRAFDVGFTSLLLANPPVALPPVGRRPVGAIGRSLAARFVRRYEHHSRTTVSGRDLAWHQGVACLRALVEAGGWFHDGLADERAGHPWLLVGDALSGHLGALTGAAVRPR